MRFFQLLLLNALTLHSVPAQVPPGSLEPKAGTWRTWVIGTASQLRPMAPGDAKATTAEIQVVKSLIGQANSDTMAQVAYWDTGSPAYRWLQLAYQQAQSAGLAPTQVTRTMALVSVAISDATIAAWDAKYAYGRQAPSILDASVKVSVAIPNAPSYPSEHAVAAGAASTVLGYLFPAQSEIFSDLAEEASRSRMFAGAALPSDVTVGLDLGRRVGQIVVSYARTDGSDAVFAGSYPPSATQWSGANPVTPLAGTWKPWVLAAGSDVRLPPPVTGADLQAQVAAVKNFARTNASNHSAWFWQPSFLGPWLDSLNRLIFENHLDGNAPRAARAYALQFTAAHDATIGCWDSKFFYLVPRPPQVDATIAPVFALPQHPSYPGGHSCVGGAMAVVEGYLFPNDVVAINAMADDAGLSTFYAAIHAMQDLDGGAALGAKAGQAAVARAKADGAQ